MRVGWSTNPSIMSGNYTTVYGWKLLQLHVYMILKDPWTNNKIKRKWPNHLPSGIVSKFRF